jgi:hypothetical protein
MKKSLAERLRSQKRGRRNSLLAGDRMAIPLRWIAAIQKILDKSVENVHPLFPPPNPGVHPEVQRIPLDDEGHPLEYSLKSNLSCSEYFSRRRSKASRT